jgi:hypothetical protein
LGDFARKDLVAAVNTVQVTQQNFVKDILQLENLLSTLNVTNQVPPEIQEALEWIIESSNTTEHYKEDIFNWSSTA